MYSLIEEAIIPLIPILALIGVKINKYKFSDIITYILSDYGKIYNQFLLERFEIWWKKTFDISVYSDFLKIYQTHLTSTKQSNIFNDEFERIINILKDSVKDREALSEWIDTYFVVHPNEKKASAEVNTPRKLRNEMLDIVPEDFWSNKEHKVFEPCCGKGGFLVDVVSRFMEGLKDVIPDERKRYKHIVEECLYFADINSINIEICKLLLGERYKLKYYCGDTLKCDIKREFGLEGFDLVVGNPPYNKNGNISTGNTIWQYFTIKSLKIWIKQEGYLLFIHPSGWRKPCYENLN